MSYMHFLFWDQSVREPVNQIGNVLELRYAESISKRGSIKKESDRIVISFVDYKFIFTFIDEDWVLEESNDIAETFGKKRTDYNRIKTSFARIEFYGEEDPNMDYFNDCLFILEEIQRELSFTIFDSDNCKFFGEF